MNIDQLAFGQIANTLAKQFDSMYYVDIESDNFIEFFHSQMLSELNLPEQGSEFFTFLAEQAKRTVHPDDMDYVLNLIDKDKLLEKLSVNNSSLIVFRFVLSGEIMHVCHFSVMCDDKKHILGCIKNIESEFREREEQEKILQSVERLARLDELTGIKNVNAFAEDVQASLKSGMNAHIAKPIDHQILQSTLEEILFLKEIPENYVKFYKNVTRCVEMINNFPYNRKVKNSLLR